MYKLMFADDEALIRRNIKKLVQWEKYGFKLTGCCDNGHELLEMIEQEVPDVVITDINMPFVSGIEVARQLRQMNPGVKVIFLTGYSDFEYAQKAIDLNVFKYILKPITVEGIQNVLSEVKKVLDEEVAKKSNVHNLEEFYTENKPIMQSVFLNNLLVDSLSSEDIYSKIKLLDLDRLEGNRFQGAVLLINRIDEESQWKENESLLEYAVYNILKEKLDDKKIGYCIMGSKKINIILSNKNCRPQDYREDFTNVLEEIRDCVNKHLKTTVTIGVGRVKEDAAMIYQSLDEANAALGYRKILGVNRLIYIKDIEPHRVTKQTVDFNFESELLNVIKIGTAEDLKNIYQRIIEEIEKEQLTLEQVRIWGITLAVNLYQDVEHTGVNISEILDFNMIKKLSDTCDFQEIYNMLFEFCLKLSEAFSANRIDSLSSITDEAVNIIKKNYGNPDLSVDMVSSMLNLSGSYFRAIFKKEMNISFGRYVTEFRMEKAKALVLTTSMKNYEIAEATGYVDPHYFSYCFKKYFNMSPNELRASVKDSNSSK